MKVGKKDVVKLIQNGHESNNNNIKQTGQNSAGVGQKTTLVVGEYFSFKSDEDSKKKSLAEQSSLPKSQLFETSIMDSGTMARLSSTKNGSTNIQSEDSSNKIINSLIQKLHEYKVQCNEVLNENHRLQNALNSRKSRNASEIPISRSEIGNNKGKLSSSCNKVSKNSFSDRPFSSSSGAKPIDKLNRTHLHFHNKSVENLTKKETQKFKFYSSKSPVAAAQNKKNLIDDIEFIRSALYKSKVVNKNKFKFKKRGSSVIDIKPSSTNAHAYEKEGQSKINFSKTHKSSLSSVQKKGNEVPKPVKQNQPVIISVNSPSGCKTSFLI